MGSGTCKKTCSNKVTLTGFEDVPSKDEDALAAAVAKQPVSVAIEADKQAFQLYKSGVFSSATCGTQLDHGVLVVGYGTESGKQYWKVKDSSSSSVDTTSAVSLSNLPTQLALKQLPQDHP